MSDRVTQIVAAAPGWRKVSAFTGFEGDLKNASLDNVIATVPIACFALVETYDTGEPQRYVRAVYPDDFPSYMWMETGTPDDHDLGYLGPGEELDDYWLKGAVEVIQKWRDNEEREGQG